MSVSVRLLSAWLAATKSVGPFPVSGPFLAVVGRLAESFIRTKTVRLVVTGIFLDPFGLVEVVVVVEVEWVLVMSPIIKFRGWKTFLNYVRHFSGTRYNFWPVMRDWFCRDLPWVIRWGRVSSCRRCRSSRR